MRKKQRETEFPEKLRKLRTPEYMAMSLKITDAITTTLHGSAAIGMLEADMWLDFQTVPNREMLLRVRHATSMEHADRLVAEVVADYRRHHI